MNRIITHSRVLVTGGAGFIGSNLVEALLAQDNEVICLDNFATGKRENITPFLIHRSFRLIEGDIRDREVCRQAVDGVTYVLHQAALGSVPRSINDPMTSTEVNITGFVNMLFAAKEAKVKRFVYASSSSVYGDNATLPKVEAKIGRQLSPYAITKYVNELFAANFTALYGIDTVGLRYFNVFGRRQDPFGAYAAVIPKFAMALINHQAPVINGDGTYSRDFTYIANVVQANQLAAITDNSAALNTAYNVACGDRLDLNNLFASLRSNLAAFDPAIAAIEPTYGPVRPGDVPHSLADISKAQNLLGYAPTVDIRQGIQEAARWYYDHLKNT
ncbi:MAG TPA: SDR family oxidoreductase [Lentisphaeria bacterium]|nr:SDR family oxidoreductase [Lentisphaeria bacterium]